MESKLKVENSKQLIELLDRVGHVHRNKAVIEGMKAGANLINTKAESKLFASKKGKGNYARYATAFKMENLKGKTPEEVGIRTGVWDKSNGYILRWLEWGTAERYTFKRKNARTNEVVNKMYRGKMEGNNFFFGTIRDNTDAVFKVVSEAILKELESLANKG